MLPAKRGVDPRSCMAPAFSSALSPPIPSIAFAADELLRRAGAFTYRRAVAPRLSPRARTAEYVVSSTPASANSARTPVSVANSRSRGLSE